MGNFGTLYRFELKKLLQRKMLWSALAILTAVAVFLPATEVMGNYYVSGGATGEADQVWSHYEIVQRQRADPAGLDGRVLDTDLIQETIDALGIISQTTTPVIGHDNAEDSVTVRQADPDERSLTLDGYVIQGQYGDIWNTVESMVTPENMTAELTGDDYYAAVALARSYNGSTAGERAWWAAQAEALAEPLTLTGYPNGGWTYLAESAYVGDLFLFLFAIIALASLFPLEHQRRTDALLRCARNGGTPLWVAKFLAGLTVSLCGGVIILGSMAAACLALLGPEDAATAVQQLMAPTYSAPMTVRQLATTVCGMYLVASLVHAAFVMTVSLCAKSSTAAMAVSFGAMLLFIMVPVIPSSHPWLSQTWSLLPAVIGATGFFDSRLVHLGGYLTNYQAAPLLWLALTLALAALAWALHRRVPRR